MNKYMIILCMVSVPWCANSMQPQKDNTSKPEGVTKNHFEFIPMVGNGSHGWQFPGEEYRDDRYDHDYFVLLEEARRLHDQKSSNTRKQDEPNTNKDGVDTKEKS